MRATAAALLVAMVLCPGTSSGVELGTLSRVSSHLELSLNAEEALRNRPVAKVINLLQGMLKALEKDAADDEEIYEALACWCKTNDKDKSGSVAEAEGRIKRITNEIEEGNAKTSRLSAALTRLTGEIKANQDALDKAKAIREKELEEFRAQEKDLLNAVAALKSAVKVLSKHNSFLQLGTSREQLRAVMQNHAARLQGVLDTQANDVLASYLQAPGFGQAATHTQEYAPQSGEIFGILRQMKETFEGDLTRTQEDEEKSQKAYEGLKAAKTEEIRAAQAQHETKIQQKAAEDEKLAKAKQDLADTKSSMSADAEFLAKLKEKCSMTDGQWEERQKTRKDEMQAVTEALSVLTEDSARDTFTRTFKKKALLQEDAAAMLLQTVATSTVRTRASALLASTAELLHRPRLAALAVQVRLDAFTKVKKAIDDMVTELEQQKADEIKHKDFCVDAFDENKLQSEKQTRNKADYEAKVSDLESTIEQLTKGINALKAEVADLQVQLKKAGEQRSMENAEFQATIADQRETAKILKVAKARLEQFYAEKKAALMQRGEPVGPAPPKGFGKYQKNQAAGGVLATIQQIIEDATALEKEALQAENDATKTYVTFVDEMKKGMEAKDKDILNKIEAKAQANQDLVEAKQELKGVEDALTRLAKENTELETSCRFALDNFDVRQKAFDQEIGALNQAKAILSGSKFSNFLQRGR